MQYAPVIIPTLNRYEHFKRCLESLEKCTGADKTDVYVGLDYPPAEKYVDGWRKIDEYLKVKEINNGFAKLIVKRRDHNLGISGENGNYQVMCRALPQGTEAYILTEDDNEFSPCFLDFMNKALEKYRDNPKVYSVCGFNQPEYEAKGKNVIFICDNSAWGLGHWTNREEPTLDYVKAKLHSPGALLKVWRAYPAIIRYMLSMANENVLNCDAAYTLMCICEGMYQIRPSFSLVRNTGDDGSGQHSAESGVFSAQKISDAPIFDFPENLVPVRTAEIDRKVRFNMYPEAFMPRLKNDLVILRDLVKYWTKRKL